MLAPQTANLVVALMLGLLQPPPDAVEQARRQLASGDPTVAVSTLESALPTARPGPGKETLIDLLGQAYQAAASQAKAAGRASDADSYQENAKILARKSRPAREKASPNASSPAASNREPRHDQAAILPPDPTPSGPVPLPDGPDSPSEPKPATPPASPEPSMREALPAPAEVAAPPPKPADAVASVLAAADSAFVAKDYTEAGRLYGKLALDRRLPPERRDQWLYCRAFAAVGRINAHPRDEAEWSSLRAEIEQIRALNPKHLLGEYVRDLAIERQAVARKAKGSKALVVRGSAPEEPPANSRPVRAASEVATPKAPAVAVAVTPESVKTRVGASVGRWQVLESANFRVYHADPKLAARVIQGAESARREQTKRWSKSAALASWEPACEVYLYPNSKLYAQMTGQPEDSPGFSTMGMNGGRITSRRINLRVDHPTMVQAVLPHELTHVILADHFTEQQIPRWADEGIAVLSEPVDEQQRRAADLDAPLGENRLFPVDVLMGMDYPEDRYWNLYYAQCVSLSRFLVEQGTPAQLIQFLQESQREGFEPVLRRVYRIDGFPDLQRRWLAFARRGVAGRGVAATPSDVRAR